MTTLIPHLALYRGGYFKLHTLYIEYSHNLEGIMADLPQLRLLGIFFGLNTFDMNLWIKIEQLYQSPSRRRGMPVVFMLGSSKFCPRLIYMFPSFYRPGEALQVCRETAASLNKWRDGFGGKWRNGFDENAEYQLALFLIGISEENISLVGEMIGAMAACRDYYPSEMYSCLNIVLHDKYIQVSCQASQYILAFIILDRSHGVFLNLLNL